MKKRVLLLVSLILMLIFVNPLMAKSKAYMGVYLKDLSLKNYEELGIKDNYGIQITKVVKDSPADKAGLLNDDVILEIAGDKIYTHDQLKKMLSFFEPEQVIKLKIFHEKKTQKVNLTLGEKKSYEPQKKAYLGVYLKDLSEKDYDKLGLKERYGVLIDKVVEDSPVQKAGVQDEDVLTELDRNKVYTSDQISKMLNNLDTGQNVNVRIFREKEYKDFDVVLGEKEITDFKFLSPSGNSFFQKRPENVFVYQYKGKNGKWIGILTMELNDQLLESYNLKHGVQIKEVLDDTPAREAGLKAGDIIIEMDGKKIKITNDIHKVIQSKIIDDIIKIELQRDKKTKTIDVKVGKRKDFEDFGKVQVSVDNGEITIWRDGKEGVLYNFSKTLDNLNNLKALELLKNIKPHLDIDSEKFIELEKELQELNEELDELEIELEILDEEDKEL